MSPILKMLIRIILWIFNIIFPWTILFLFQAVSLPYHSNVFITVQRLAILIDVIITLRLIPDITSGVFGNYPTLKEWKKNKGEFIKKTYAVLKKSMVVFYLGILFIILSTFFLTIQGEFVDHFRNDILTYIDKRLNVCSSILDPITSIFIDKKAAECKTAGTKYKHSSSFITFLDTISQRNIDIQYAILSLPDKNVNKIFRCQNEYPETNCADEIAKQINQKHLDLRGRNLENSNFKFSLLSSTLFIGANLSGSNMQKAHAQYSYFIHARLENVDLNNGCLKHANFKSANLKNVNLKNANLQYADLTEANLEGANLEDADLQGAILDGANLCGANLRNSKLTGATLINTALYGADLFNANLDITYIKNSTFNGSNIQLTSFEGSLIDDTLFELTNIKNASFYLATIEELNTTGSHINMEQQSTCCPCNNKYIKNTDIDQQQIKTIIANILTSISDSKKKELVELRLQGIQSDIQRENITLSFKGPCRNDPKKCKKLTELLDAILKEHPRGERYMTILREKLKNCCANSDILLTEQPSSYPSITYPPLFYFPMCPANGDLQN